MQDNMEKQTGFTSASGKHITVSVENIQKAQEILGMDDEHFQLELVPCSSCGRKFAKNRIQIHENICKKVGKTNRPKFDSKRSRFDQKTDSQKRLEEFFKRKKRWDEEDMKRFMPKSPPPLQLKEIDPKEETTKVTPKQLQEFLEIMKNPPTKKSIKVHQWRPSRWRGIGSHNFHKRGHETTAKCGKEVDYQDICL